VALDPAARFDLGEEAAPQVDRSGRQDHVRPVGERVDHPEQRLLRLLAQLVRLADDHQARARQRQRQDRRRQRLRVRLVAVDLLERAEGRARADGRRLDRSEAAIDEQRIADQEGDPRRRGRAVRSGGRRGSRRSPAALTVGARAQKSSTIEL
jgi:hypothetical protein